MKSKGNLYSKTKCLPNGSNSTNLWESNGRTAIKQKANTKIDWKNCDKFADQDPHWILTRGTVYKSTELSRSQIQFVDTLRTEAISMNALFTNQISFTVFVLLFTVANIKNGRTYYPNMNFSGYSAINETLTNDNQIVEI